MVATGYTIKKRENASITIRRWRLRLLGGWRGPLWSMLIVRNGVVSFCHLPNGFSILCLSFSLFFRQVRQSRWLNISSQTCPASIRIVLQYCRFLKRPSGHPFRFRGQVWNRQGNMLRVSKYVGSQTPVCRKVRFYIVIVLLLRSEVGRTLGNIRVDLWIVNFRVILLQVGFLCVAIIEQSQELDL